MSGIRRNKCLMLNHDQKNCRPFFSTEEIITGAFYIPREGWNVLSFHSYILHIIFQLESVPTNLSLGIQDCLDEHYTGCWIWWGRPIEWVAYSPDLTPYYLFMKEMVYYTKMHSLSEKNKAGISTAVTTRHVWKGLDVSRSLLWYRPRIS